MNALHTLTLVESIEKLRSKEISIRELYNDVQAQIVQNNSLLNVFLTFDHEAGVMGEKMGEKPLRGVPIAVKDNFLTKGTKTTASTKVLADFVPPFDATVIGRIKHAGGVIIGKTNMDAWAHGSSTETSNFGPTKNPRNPEYLPGGSSGGSAAAVAADMTIAAIGTETAGSIRQPASWCGVVGLKPTYGRVSRYGVVPMASSTDSPGPIGKTVEDCAFLLNCIAGNDPYDGTTSMRPVPDFTKNLKNGVKGLKIGICYLDHPEVKGLESADAIIKAGQVFRKLGAEVHEVPMSDTVQRNHIFNPSYAISVYTVVQRSEVSSNLAGYNGIRYDSGRTVFGAEAKRRIMLGTFTLSEGYADKYYVKAQKIRSLYIQNHRDLFQTYDLLIAPTSPGYAKKTGASEESAMFGELQDMLLEPSSISGLPGISLPCFMDPKTNLYLGLNIMAAPWQEEKMLQAAYAYEQATDWNQWIKKRV